HFLPLLSRWLLPQLVSAACSPASRRPVIARALPCPAFAAVFRAIALSLPCLALLGC
ncbi:hypothetical protein HN873_067307, partial [Arachis hypogaea]